MRAARTIIENTIVPHTAFVEAQGQLEVCFKYAAQKTEAEGLAIIGESGTGKTSVLNEFAALHPAVRTQDGLEVPILRATVPSQPTIKSLAGVMLASLGATDAERGTENEKSSRLRVLMKNSGTRMVMIDEFQHFIDRNRRKVMRDNLQHLVDHLNECNGVPGLNGPYRVLFSKPKRAGARSRIAVQLAAFNREPLRSWVQGCRQ